MPQFVQQISGQSYALIEPRLGWARGKVSLLDGACGRLERVMTPVIGTADRCIDGSVEAVAARATAVRVLVSNRVAPVRAKIVEAQSALVLNSLGLLDSSEKLIDRVLPLPRQPQQDPLQEEETERVQSETRLVYRLARLPLAVPIRITMIVYVKANCAVDAVTLSARHVTGLAFEKQKQFAQNVLDRARPLTDRIADASSLSLNTVQNNSVVRRVAVRVNNMVIRMHVVEAKAWSVKKASDLRVGSQTLVLAVLRRAHDTTAHIVGQPRAKALFGKWQPSEESSERIPETQLEQEAFLEEAPEEKGHEHEVALKAAPIPLEKEQGEHGASRRVDEDALAALEVEDEQKGSKPVLEETSKDDAAKDTFDDITPRSCSSLNSAIEEKVDLGGAAPGELAAAAPTEHASATPKSGPLAASGEQVDLTVSEELPDTAPAPRQELAGAACKELPESTRSTAQEPVGTSIGHEDPGEAASTGLTGTAREEFPKIGGAHMGMGGSEVMEPAAKAQTGNLASKSRRKNRSRSRTAHGVS